MKTETLKKSCDTCLYMATHENCDGCLDIPEAEQKPYKPGEWPEYPYTNYVEGNWMKRVMQFELDGRHSIVIGGQGEAEVNTKRTPQETLNNLRNVAEQCGYMVSGLEQIMDFEDNCCGWFLGIATSNGIFRLIWDNNGLEYICACNHDWKPIAKIWDREKIKQRIAGMKD